MVALSSEGANSESLDFTEAIINAGKPVFHDKPAGDDSPRFERIVEQARRDGLLIQLGYMFRNHDGFERIAAYQLCSQVARVRLANMVDVLYSIVAKFPKRYLLEA